MLKKFLCLAVLCLQMSASFAQEKWSLEKCIQYALENNVQLKITALNIEANQATLDQSQMARLPNLNAFIGPGWAVGRQIDPFSNAFVDQQVWRSSFSLTSNTVLFNGFQQVTAIEQNKTNVQISRLDTEKAKNDLILNITNAYVQILFNKELISVALLQLQNTEEQLSRTLKLIEAGRLPEANKYDVISQKANDELRITQAENNLAIVQLRLRQLLQVPVEQAFDIEVPVVAEPGDELVLTPVDQIFQTAESMQPDIKGADLAIRSSELGIKLARASRYPTVTLSLSLSSLYSNLGQRPLGKVVRDTILPIGWTGGENPELDPSKVVYTQRRLEFQGIEKSPFFYQLGSQNLQRGISLNIQIPIFNRYQITNNITQATIQTSRARLQSQNVRNLLRQTIEQAYVDARAASKSYASNKQRVRALEESAKVTEQKFNFGAANSIDYALAKNNLAIAQSELVRTKYEYVLRLKILDFYEGREVKF